MTVCCIHVGVISSNGVNGSQATETDSGTGIQVLCDSPQLHLTRHVPAVCTTKIYTCEPVRHVRRQPKLVLEYAGRLWAVIDTGWVPSSCLSGTFLSLSMRLHLEHQAQSNSLVVDQVCATAAESVSVTVKPCMPASLLRQAHFMWRHKREW